MGAGLKVRTSLKKSLDATGNAAYPATYERASELLKAGDDLHTSLQACHIFPDDFLNIVASAEEGGRVPEVMEQQVRGLLGELLKADGRRAALPAPVALNK